MKFYIRSEKGYYRDVVDCEFVPSKEEAQAFDSIEEATRMMKFLKEVDKVKGLKIVEDDKTLALLEVAKQMILETEAYRMNNPTEDEIQVVVVEPFKKPYKKMIKNDFKAMQEIVGGFFEQVTIGDTKKGDSVAIILNEEGKLRGLPINRRLMKYEVGTFFITAYNEYGDNISLTNEEARYYIRRFTPMEVYLL